MLHARRLAFLCLALIAASRGLAAEGPFIGVDLGVSEPTKDNYRGHVRTGATASPFVGYMMNDFFGLQGNAHFIAQYPDDDHRGNFQSNLDHENRMTTLAGLTAGPRLSLPLGDVADFYVLGQGGGFKGMGGRLNQWAPGISAGPGLDFNLSDNVGLGFYGRWNRAYMAPHPYILGGPFPQKASELGPKDAEWVTAGVTLKYTFTEPPLPPPPPPAPVKAEAPPPPPPPVKKKIVLRNVNFDFDKSNIRPDARPVLDEATATLKREPDSLIVIVEGHTDSKGSDAYNMKLSQRRADSVRSYLVSHGLSSNRIKTEALGESRPVASNDTAEGRSQNRRVELHVE